VLKLHYLKPLVSLTLVFFFLLFVLKFTFAYQTWTSPANISNLPYNSAVPRVAVDQFGGVHAVWVEAPDPVYLEAGYLYYSYKAPSGSWSTPERIAEATAYPDIAVDSQGITHLVWVDGPAHNLSYSSKPLNGVWSIPLVLSQPGGCCNIPSITVDRQDSLHLAWSSDTVGMGDIFYIFKPAAGTWSEMINISNTDNPSGFMSLTTDASGNIYAVWQELISLDNWDIFFNKKIPGGNWDSPTNISNTPSGSLNPIHWPVRLSGDPQGNLHIVWREEFYDASGATNYGIYYMSKTSLGWTQAQRLSIGVYPDVAVDQTGTAHVIWSGSAGNQVIFYTSKPLDSSSFSGPISVSPIPADSFYSAITTDSENIHILFMNNGAGYYNGEIYYTTARIPYKVTWLPPLSTQEIYTMHDGATLPVKFNLINPDGSQATDANVMVVITEDATGTQWSSETAVYDPALPGYSVKVSTQGWPLGEYTISLVGDRLVHDATYGLNLVEAGKGKGKEK